jgi:Flp pilus assembly protein TadD
LTFDYWRHKAIVIILPVVCAVITLIIVSPSTRQLVTDKAAVFVDLQDKPIQFRLLTWRSTLSMIAEYPLGIGLANYEMRYPEYRTVQEHRISGRFKKVDRAHNEYLQTAAELGAYGLVAFLFLVASFFRAGLNAAKTAKTRETRLMSQAIVVGQLAMLVHSFFCFPLQLPVTLMMFWVFCGLVGKSKVESQKSKVNMNAVGAVHEPPCRKSKVQSPKSTQIAAASAFIGGALVVAIIHLSASEFFSDYHQSQGLELKKEANYGPAAAAFQKASEFCGSCFLNHYLASVCLRNIGRIDEAIEESTKSLKYNSNDRHSIFNLGALYSYKGLTYEAIELWKRVLVLDPDYAQAYFNMGAVYGHRGEDGMALSAYENALRIDPTLVQACHNMVVILEKMGKLTEARNALVRSIENARDLQLRLDLARVYAKLGEIGNAQRTLLEAKELFGEDDRIDELFRKLPR